MDPTRNPALDHDFNFEAWDNWQRMTMAYQKVSPKRVVPALALRVAAKRHDGYRQPNGEELWLQLPEPSGEAGL
ncbi:hypothetical protein LJY25_12460 [Hymenobacter sp. BT175]|uniref:hypothetical protein n=1 Tax=Hymenobacter translucens TaxID=2886507 RepID=UPI001D0DD0D3|nr:hypothetical protein [Hymenobacter translucens]MCC2547260.1 hypothetical protein [Hymenobacter translucens]